MEEQRKKEFFRVFYHEIGHWFVAKQVSFTPQEIKIESRNLSKWESHGHCSTVLYRKCEGLDDIIEYLHDRQLVLLAGAVFEAAMTGNGVDYAIHSLHNGSSNDDYRKFLELAMVSLNFKLGSISESLDEINQTINVFGCDELLQSLLAHRKQLACEMFIMCKNEAQVKDFVDEAVSLVDYLLMRNTDFTNIEFTESQLNNLYVSTVNEYCLSKEKNYFNRGPLSKLHPK
ncbi:Peptidase M41 domain-containing protein [Klebsiella variicola subsp. variicola]|uniref:hypothetical protein n=1 Tax=Klebsiella variicola TaxID=244366 RepID=UPI00101CAABF|nr:hypothetical protein [Klebsiella variicola]HBZ7808020.1 hypothetical protein [Klebsiella variicola subsp. variicola]